MEKLTHLLIGGMTKSGKTLYARQMTRGLSSVMQSLIFDPTSEARGPNVSGWSAAWVTSDWEEFSKVFWDSRGCLVVIDEAAIVCQEDVKGLRRMLMAGRHNGHMCVLIAQRPKRIDKTAREQCTEVILFRVSPSDAAEIAEDFAEPGLNAAAQLPPLEYYQKNLYGPLRRGLVKP